MTQVFLATKTEMAVVQEAPLNVKDARFGAVLDGVTDDWLALKAARDLAATATKGEIYIPPGVLLINSATRTYNPPDHVRLFGAGPGRSTIKAGPNTTSNMIGAATVGSTGAAIERLTIDDNNRGFFGMQMATGTGTMGTTDFTINDVEILNTTAGGIVLTRAIRPHLHKVRIVNVAAGGVAGVGIWLFGGTIDGDLGDIYIENTASHGLALDAGTTGGVVGTTADEVTGHTIRGLHVKTCAKTGLLFEGAPRNTVQGVILDACGTSGLPAIGLPACELNEDQSLLRSDDNDIGGMIILNSPSTPLMVRNSSRNKVRARVEGVGRGGSNNPAVLVYAFTSGVCEDNDVEVVASDDGAGAYEYGVLHRGEAGSSVKGNKTRGSFGRGARAPTTISSTSGSVITVPFTGADANVVSVDAPLVGPTRGQRGIMAPPHPTRTTLVPVASRGYLARIEPPERDLLIINGLVDVTNPATNNDESAIAIWDETLTTILVTSGALTSKMNGSGWVAHALAATVLRAGTPYYAEFTYGTVGGTAATLLADNKVSASTANAFGSTIATGLEFDIKNTRHPPTAPYGALGGASNVTPVIVLREV